MLLKNVASVMGKTYDKHRNSQQHEKDKQVIDTVKKRKMSYFKRILRNEKYELMSMVLEGKIDGRRRQEK